MDSESQPQEVREDGGGAGLSFDDRSIFVDGDREEIRSYAVQRAAC